MKSIHAFFLLFVILFGASRSAMPQSPRPPNRSDRQEISVSLTPEASTVMLGVPTYFTFTVKNNSDREIEAPSGACERWIFVSSTVKATNALGEPVPAPEIQQNPDGMSWWAKVPPKGEHGYRVYPFSFAIITKPGAYTFTATPIITIRYPNSSADDTNDRGIEIHTKATARLTIAPKNKRKLGELIAKLGNDSFASPTAVNLEALSTLGAIHDERVIPWFVRAMHTGDYDSQFEAMEVFGRFNNDESLKRLEEGLSLKGSVAELESNIVVAACDGLLRSPHPRALQILIEHRHDANDQTRNSAVSALYRLDKKRALPILEEMLKDKSQMIRDNAGDALNHFNTAPPEEGAVAYRTADDLWAHIEALEKWIPTGPVWLDLDRLRQALAGFRKRYPNDSRYWRGRLEVVRWERAQNGMSVNMTRGASSADFPDTENKLKEIIRARHAPKDVRADARVELIESHMGESYGDSIKPKIEQEIIELTHDFPQHPRVASLRQALINSHLGECNDKCLTQKVEREIVEFARDFPQDACIASLQERRLKSLETMDPAKAADLANALQKDPNPAVVKMAQVRQRTRELCQKPFDLKFTALDGTPVDLSKLRGKVVVIAFWDAEHPTGNLEMHMDFRSQGLEVIGVALDEDKERVESVIERYHIHWPQLFDGKGKNNELVSKYNIAPLPIFWVVDKKGMVVDTRAKLATLENQLIRLSKE